MAKRRAKPSQSEGSYALTVHLPVDLVRRLKSFAGARLVSGSKVVEEALERHLAGHYVARRAGSRGESASPVVEDDLE